MPHICPTEEYKTINMDSKEVQGLNFVSLQPELPQKTKVRY